MINQRPLGQISRTRKAFGQMIYSKSDEFLIALSKNFNSARLNLMITGLKIDNNDIITWII
jgi:hypothetical protein